MASVGSHADQGNERRRPTDNKPAERAVEVEHRTSRGLAACCLTHSNQQDEDDEHVALLRDMRRPLLETSAQTKSSTGGIGSTIHVTSHVTRRSTTRESGATTAAAPTSTTLSPTSAKCCCHHCRKCGRCTNPHHHHLLATHQVGSSEGLVSPPGSPTLCKSALSSRTCPGPGGPRVAPSTKVQKSRLAMSMPAIVAPRASLPSVEAITTGVAPSPRADISVAIQEELATTATVAPPATRAKLDISAVKLCSNCSCAIVLARLRATSRFQTVNGFSRQYDTCFPDQSTSASGTAGEDYSTLTKCVPKKEFAIAMMAINETASESFPSVLTVLVGYLVTLLCLGTNLFCCGACGTFTSQMEANVNDVLGRINSKPCFQKEGVIWKFKRSTCSTWVEISLTQVVIDPISVCGTDSSTIGANSVTSSSSPLVVAVPLINEKTVSRGERVPTSSTTDSGATSSSNVTWSSQRLLLASMRAAPWPQAVQKAEVPVRRATITRRTDYGSTRPLPAAAAAAAPPPAASEATESESESMPRSLPRRTSAPPSIMTVYDL